MTTLFVSYRRADGGYAGRVYDRLASEFGDRNVFRDQENIGVGTDFVSSINGNIDRSDFLLAVIGREWDPARLHDAGDYVRMEIARALNAGSCVIPVLVGGSSMPTNESLPTDIRVLASRQNFNVRDESFDDDIDRLVREVRILKRGRSQRFSLGAWLLLSSSGRRTRLWRRLPFYLSIAASVALAIFFSIVGIGSAKLETVVSVGFAVPITCLALRSLGDSRALTIPPGSGAWMRARHWLLLYRPWHWWGWILRVPYYYYLFAFVWFVPITPFMAINSALIAWNNPSELSLVDPLKKMFVFIFSNWATLTIFCLGLRDLAMLDEWVGDRR